MIDKAPLSVEEKIARIRTPRFGGWQFGTGPKPIFDDPMTKAERQRRWRARKAGKPLPVNLAVLRQTVTEALDDLAQPGRSDDDRKSRLAHWQAKLDREFAGRPK
jgi:hypothetical protein